MLFFQLIVIQAVVFGFLIFFLKKILYGDTQSAMKRLDHVYNDLLKKQKELTQKIEQAEGEYNAKKEEAEKIGAKIKNDVAAEAKKKEDEIIKTARAQAAEILDKARASVDKNQRDLEKKVRAELVGVALQLLKAALSKGSAELLHQQLIKEFMERGEQFDLSSVGADLKKVTLKTAFALKKADEDKIRDIFTKKIGRKFDMEMIVDEQLLSGALLQFDTLLLDGTLANTLKEISVETQRNIENQS